MLSREVWRKEALEMESSRLRKAVAGRLIAGLALGIGPAVNVSTTQQ